MRSEETEVPYKDMVRQNQTIHEVEPIELSNGYRIRVRVKRFILVDREGTEYERGPCTSLQLFHGSRFIKALALEQGIEHELMDRLRKVRGFLYEAEAGEHST